MTFSSGVAPISVPLLRDISTGLHANLVIAEREALRAQIEVGRLVHSSNLVNGLIKALEPGILSPGSSFVFDANFAVTGQLVIDASQTYTAAKSLDERAFVSRQIETALTSAVSASLSALSAADQAATKPVADELLNHGAALIDLEQQADTRLAAHGAHLQIILRGAIASFRDAANPLRFTNTANGLRELIREFLEVVAPNAKVKLARWFVPDITSKSGITRRHRMRLAIFGEIPEVLFPALFVENATDLVNDLIDGIESLSAFTHVTAAVLATPEAEAAGVLAGVPSV